MQSQESLIDRLLREKENRPAAQTYEGVSQWWKQSFGGDMPVRNLGASEFEKRAGHEHSRAFDVGIHPSSAQGQRFIKYLQSQGIPYSAFDRPITKNGRIIATGPHIHVGIPSPNIGTAQPAESLVDRLLKAKEAPAPAQQDADVSANAQWNSAVNALNVFAKGVEDVGAGQWKFFDPVIKKARYFNSFNEMKAELARHPVGSQYLQMIQNEDPIRMKANAMMLQQGLTPERLAAEKKRLMAEGSPFIGSKIRTLKEAAAKGTAGILDLAAGIVKLTPRDPLTPKSDRDAAVAAIQKPARELNTRVEQAEEVAPLSGKKKFVRDIGAGAIEFAPMMLTPELGIEGVLAKIGTSALTFGGYSAAQEVGRGGGTKEVAKAGAAGAALGTLFGVPLPGKTILRKGLSNLVIMGGGGTVVNLATGQTLEESATSGLALMLLRSPELIKGIRVKTVEGERPATMREIRGLLPAAKFDIETGMPKPEATTPATKKPYYRTRQAIVEPQGASTEIPPQAEPQLVEAGLSTQYPSVMRMSEQTARSSLDQLKALKENKAEWGRLKPGQKASVDAQIKTLEEQGVASITKAERPRRASRLTQDQVDTALDIYFSGKKPVAEKTQPAVAESPVPEAASLDRVESIETKLRDMGAGTATLENAPPVRLAAINDTRAELAKAKEESPASEPTKTLAQVAAEQRAIRERGELTQFDRENLDAERRDLQKRDDELRQQEREDAKRIAAGGVEAVGTVGGVARGRGSAIAEQRAQIATRLADIDNALASPASGVSETQPSSEMETFRAPNGELVTVPASTFTESKQIAQEAVRRRIALEAEGDKGLESIYAKPDPNRPGKKRLDFDAVEAERTAIAKLDAESDRLRLLEETKALKEKPSGVSQPEAKRKGQEGFLNIGDVARAMDDLRKRFPDLSEAELRLRFMAEHQDRFAKPVVKAGQEGSASISAISGGAVGLLEKVRQTATMLAKSHGVRATMAYTRDVVDNAASKFATEMRGEVEGPLRRSLGTSKEATDALTFVIESQGDPSALAAMRTKITTSTKALPGWKKRALTAIDYAEKNYAKLNTVAQRYEEITTEQVNAENTAGIDTLKRKGYVMHAQDLEGAPVGWLSGGSGAGETTGFKKVRVYDTYADSIAAGVNPKSLNALDLLSARLNNGQRLINRRAWTADLKSMADARTGAPLAVDPLTVKRADGTSYQQAPDGYALQQAGIQGQQIAIANGYEGVYSALNDPSWFSKNAGTRMLTRGNALGKSFSLMLDTYHLGRLAFWESLIKGLGVKTFKAPFPSYRKGLTLLDMTPDEILRMEKAGEIPATWTKDLMESKRRIDMLVDQGYNVGRIADNLHQEIVHALPVIGNFNKWLFGQFQRGAMTEVGLLEFERLRRARPAMSDAQVARQVAKDLNTRFGNLGRQGVFKSRTAQDIARFLALAPQWNEGLIRSEVGALVQSGKFIGDLAQGKKIYSGVLMRSVGGMAVAQFVANQLINLYTRGKPTWENPEEGFGAKVSAWLPDKFGNGPGFFLHPMGLAAETTHLLMSGVEKTGNFWDGLNSYARSRASVAMRPVITFLTKEDFMGRPLRSRMGWETLTSALPVPIPAPAITSVFKGKEDFPGQRQRTLMSSVGIRTERAPSGEQRIRRLARAFNESKGIEKQGEFYESPYQLLTGALGSGGANEALTELLKLKTKAEILAYYERRIDHPMTGKADREQQFLKTLNPEQRSQYNASRQRRRQDLQEIRKLLSHTH